MSFETVLREAFPGSLPLSAYVGRTRLVLGRHGLSPGSALALVASCPDELCDPLRQELRRVWGDVFDAAGLAGVPTIGRLGVSAALDHVPIVSGRGRLICFVMAHIGLGPAGEVGVCVRRGRGEPSGACGALIAIRDRVAAGPGQPGAPALPDADLGDPATRYLLEAILPGGDRSEAADLMILTHRALTSATAAFALWLREAAEPDTVDYAVLPGVQVHGPGRRDYVWSAAGFAVVGGERRALDLA